MAGHGNSTEDHRFRDARERVRSWLEADGYNVVDLSPSPEMKTAWVLSASDPMTGYKVLLAQAASRPCAIEIITKLDISDADFRIISQLDRDDAESLIFDIALRLLQMNLTFYGVSHPLRTIGIESKVYVEDLTHNEFATHMRLVKSGWLVAVWCVAKALGRTPEASPPPPSFSIN